VFESASKRTFLDEESATSCASALKGQCHFKACKQLFSTLNAEEQSNLQPLKPVFYETTEIPKHMSAALSMIGHFDTKLGKVEVRDAPNLFRRWLLKGLLSFDCDFKDIIDNNIKKEITMEDANNMVFRDSYGKMLLDRLATEKLKLYHDDPFTITLNGTAIPCSVPLMDAKSDINSINTIYPNADNMTKMMKILKMSKKDFASGKDPGDDTWDNLLGPLGLNIAPSYLTDSVLRQLFNECTRTYTTDFGIHISAILEIGAPPSGDSGFSAQTICSDGNAGTTSLPLSDSDRMMGFTYSPCTGFYINPKFKIYGQRTDTQLRSEMAKRDLRRNV